MFLFFECLAAVFLSALAYVYIVYKLKKEKGEEAKLLSLEYDKFSVITSITIGIVSVVSVLVMRLYREKPLEEVFIYLLLLIFFLVSAVIDWKAKIIPNEVILAGLAFFVIAVLLRVFVSRTVFLAVIYNAILGGLIIGGVLLLIALLVKSALGMGDVKMFFVAGLFLGYINAYFLVFATVVIMAIFSIVLLITKKADRKTAIPMAPFTAAAFLFCIFIGM